ncbi:hypothetical protein [Mesoflavibacter zeaxanthinifaciens]|uniref:hypothetical protein n=1 Tax=Mesoflavibacter zeaxanthinifaciens TaxID=393060 RepID=UPI003A944A6B
MIIKLRVLSIIILLVSFSCKEKKVVSEKEEVIYVFKKEMKILADSSVYYFDQGISELNKEIDPDSISREIKDKLKILEKQIDQKSRAFQEKAIKLKLTKEEYQQVFVDLNQLMKPIIQRHKELSEKGVDFN